MSITSKLVKDISVNLRGHVNEELLFSNVFIDSRQVTSNGLFIPIVGERFDGHDFLLGAINNGAIASLWDEKVPIPIEVPREFPLFFVTDTQKALEALAKKYLKQIAPIVIGVTGSNGKTSTKDLLESVLSRSFRTHKTAGNYNNQIGLPLTILSMKEDCQVAILEMGMNNFGEISLLSNIAEPKIAIITNIGESHIEQLGSREGIAKAKLEIVDGLQENGLLIIDGDEPLLVSAVENITTKTCGYNDNNDFQITGLQQKSDYTSFTINGENTYNLKLLGKHNVKNSLYVIAVAKFLGIDEQTIQQGIENCTLTGMRMEKNQGLNGSMIINDAYNSSPTSMKAAIETIKQLENFTKRILVLGDMYELGKDEKELHMSVTEVISAPITHLFTVGEKGKWISEAFLKQPKDNIIVKTFLTKEEVTKQLINLLDDSSIVLIKASRGMKLETITADLYS